MSDVESQDRPRPVHPRCSAAEGSQAPGYPDRSADAGDVIEFVAFVFSAIGWPLLLAWFVCSYLGIISR